MNDKEILIKLVSQHVAKIAKMIFPSMPIQATETLVTMGIKNQASKYEQMIGFFFDGDNNLPSPDEFWQVAKSIMDDKPITIPVFGKVIRVSGSDVEEIRDMYLKRKS